MKGDKRADRGVVAPEEMNIPLGHRPAFSHDDDHGSDDYFVCGHCGKINSFQGRYREKKNRDKVREMLADRFCTGCKRYADGRDLDLTQCSKLPDGPGSTCRSVWPRIQSAWCKECKDAVVGG